jgi:FAD/FMN-containing dehydrogenase
MGAGVRVIDWAALQRAIGGEVLVPGSAAYEIARRPAIANFADARPAAVVRCSTDDDVAATLAFARRHAIHVTARSGGHCFAGRSSSEGIVIDVRPMRDVSVSSGVARIGAGARLGELYDALDAHGLTIPAGCGPTVGIAGLTLGGGHGVIGRRHGLTCDRLLAARVVLADGRVVDCDEQREPDLFWALRGAGGGQVGIVTSLVFDPIPAPSVTTFQLSWPAADAAAVVAAWQDWAPTAPDELHAAVQLAAGVDVASPPAVALAGAMLAGEDETRALVGELIARAGAGPRSASFAAMPYREAKRSMVRPEPPGRRYARSEFFRRSLPAQAIGELADNLAGERRPGQVREINFIPWGGAYNRVDAAATAFAHRDERFLVEHVAVAPDGDDAARRWVARSWSCAHPWGSGGVYPNFPDPELEDWATAYHGANAPRLRAVKRAYDPERVLRFHQSL